MVGVGCKIEKYLSKKIKNIKFNRIEVVFFLLQLVGE